MTGLPLPPRRLLAGYLLGLLVLPGWIVACAHHHEAVERVAHTDWDCDSPVPWVHLSGLFIRDRTILEHEAIHVDQARAMGCAEWGRASRDPVRYEVLEREAVCEAHRRVFGRVHPDCQEG